MIDGQPAEIIAAEKRGYKRGVKAEKRITSIERQRAAVYCTELNELRLSDQALLRKVLEEIEPIAEYGRIGTRDIVQARLQALCLAIRARLGEKND